jgi:response regulator RpfG family c-di-GMP phosphodiesterase
MFTFVYKSKFMSEIPEELLSFPSDFNTMDIHVLYVDDEEHNLQAFKAAFRREFTVHTALSAQEGRKLLHTTEIHILFTDQRMPEQLGTEFLAEVVNLYPDQVRVLITGYTDFEALQDAVNRGQINKYIKKPWDEEMIRQTILDGYKVQYLRKRKEKLSADLFKVNEQLEFMLRQKLIS